MPLMPTDDKGVSVQVLRLRPGSSSNVDIEATSKRGEFPAGAKIIRIANTADCWFRLGASTVEATSSDFLMLAGEHIMSVERYTHIAVLRFDDDGIFNMGELS